MSVFQKLRVCKNNPFKGFEKTQDQTMFVRTASCFSPISWTNKIRTTTETNIHEPAQPCYHKTSFVSLMLICPESEFLGRRTWPERQLDPWNFSWHVSKIVSEKEQNQRQTCCRRSVIRAGFRTLVWNQLWCKQHHKVLNLPVWVSKIRWTKSNTVLSQLQSGDPLWTAAGHSRMAVFRDCVTKCATCGKNILDGSHFGNKVCTRSKCWGFTWETHSGPNKGQIPLSSCRFGRCFWTQCVSFCRHPQGQHWPAVQRQTNNLGKSSELFRSQKFEVPDITARPGGVGLPW